jgi:hypothetical protein|tara:strand:+ start:610 stop:777 length:168 start_codon:yes stop_codon:yes gene_type:complete
MSSFVVDYLLSASSNHPLFIWNSAIELSEVNWFKVTLVGTFMKIDCIDASAVHYA